MFLKDFRTILAYIVIVMFAYHLYTLCLLNFHPSRLWRPNIVRNKEPKGKMWFNWRQNIFYNSFFIKSFFFLPMPQSRYLIPVEKLANQAWSRFLRRTELHHRWNKQVPTTNWRCDWSSDCHKIWFLQSKY